MDNFIVNHRDQSELPRSGMSLSDRKIRSSGYSALRLAKGEELLAMGLMRLRRRRERERGPKRTKRGTEGPEEGSRDRSGRKEGSRRGGEIQSRPGNLIREDQKFLEKPSFNNWEIKGGGYWHQGHPSFAIGCAILG